MKKVSPSPVYLVGMAGSTLLYLAPLRRTFDELTGSLERMSWIKGREVGREHHWVGAGLDVRWEITTEAAEAAARTRYRYYALVVVDCRQLADESEGDAAQQEAVLHEFLERLRAERDNDRRFPFERVVVLIGGADTDRTDRLLFEAGAHHVGMCLRDGGLAPGLAAGAAPRARAEFLHHLWDLAQTLLTGRKVTRSALCCAGGGITGIFYELGVLKCLQDAFVDFDLRDFDSYFGISAGSIVTTLLANQLSVDELIDRFGAGRSSEIDVELTLRHLNVRDLPMRLRATTAQLISYARQVAVGNERLRAAQLLWQLATMLGPIFRGDAIERRYARFLGQGGRTNDFRELPCELYVGATDQDARKHVLFGDADHRDVPISKAVQASTAIHPFLSSVEIGGRRYTDGFVTRTSNLTAAIRGGANLIFVIDPFLPMVSEAPGATARNGLLWGVLQDYKTVAYTRFEQVSDTLLRQNPHVTCFTFVPSNRMRRLMARNPMSTADFDAVVVEAYRSTFRRLRRLESKLGPRLQEHGISIDLVPVAATVERLRAQRLPSARALFSAASPREAPRPRSRQRGDLAA